MLLTTEVSISIQGGNIHYYNDLGYTDIKVKDIITIPINHLPKTSHEKVLIKCDKCGSEKESHYFAYNKYLKNSTDNEYLCYKCNDKNRKKTLLDKYGVDSLINNEEFNVKRKKTMLDKFGFEHPCKSEEIKKKIANTNLERYGVEHPAQLKKFRDKINETNLERYGNINSLINEKTLEKTSKTMVEKYGVKCQFQRIEIRDKSKKAKIIKIIEKENNIIKIDYEKSIYIVNCDQNKDHIFNISPHLYYNRKRYNVPICTICNPVDINVSGSEIMLLNFIRENYNGEILLNSRSIIKPYELDIYIPELKLAFEYNGLYWHSEEHKDKNYHLNKTEMCESNDIELIHIWEDDWLFKQNIIKSIISDKMSNNIEIDSTYCEIEEFVDIKLIKEFLDNNHIKGFIKSNIKIGLFNEKELISLMIFSKNKNKYELLRFCDKLNTSVIDSEIKMFKYFINKYQPEEIVAVSDRSFKENFFDKLGFKIQEKTDPNFYFIKDFIRYKKLENVENERILKIYDSGNIIYKINI